MARERVNQMLASQMAVMHAMVQAAWPGGKEAHAHFANMLKRLQG